MFCDIFSRQTSFTRAKSGLPGSGKSRGKLYFIEGQGKVREFCIRSGNL